jgi:hypothetical protein
MKRVALGTVQRGEIATIPAAALDPPYRKVYPVALPPVGTGAVYDSCEQEASVGDDSLSGYITRQILIA